MTDTQLVPQGQKALQPKTQNLELPVFIPEFGLDILQVGSMVAKSGLFKDMTMEKAVTLMMIGQRLGFDAIPSLQHIVVVEGHIFIEYPLVGARIKSTPGYDYHILEEDEKHCVVEFIKHEKVEGTYTFTIEDARRAGLVKPNSNWDKWPKVMLFSRALTQGQRRYIPEVMGGLTIYDTSEREEIVVQDTRQIASDLTAQVLQAATVTTPDGETVDPATGEVLDEAPATEPGEVPDDITDPFKLQ